MGKPRNEQEVHKKFYKQIYEKIEQEPFANFLGIKLISMGEGTASAELDVQEHMLNAHGTVHGAIIFALADYSFAAACNSHGKTSVGLSTTVNFMASKMPGSRLKAIAIEEKRSNHVAWYKVRVESDEELIATMEAVAYRKDQYFVPVEAEESKSITP